MTKHVLSERGDVMMKTVMTVLHFIEHLPCLALGYGIYPNCHT